MKKTKFLGICLIAAGLLTLLGYRRYEEKETVISLVEQEQSYGFTVKVVNHLGEALEGTSFQLYHDQNGSVPIRYVNRLLLSDNKNVTTSLESTTRQDGILHFYGLETGIYYLEETQVPPGYKVKENRIAISVDAKNTEKGIDYYIVNGAIK